MSATLSQKMSSSSSSKPKTPAEIDEDLIKEIEEKIEEVVELLSLRKDVFSAKTDLESMRVQHGQTRGSKEQTWLQHKTHKNIAVSKHARGNLDLLAAMREYKKFTKHPIDLLKHLDELTDRLLEVAQRQFKRRGASLG